MACAPAPLLAQTASQITPSTLRPEQPRLSGAVVFSGQPGLEAPPGADRLSVRIAGVDVEGGLPELAPAQHALEARLLRGSVPVSEVFAAAQSLEEAYAAAGYVLARVVLPAQRLQDGGRLRLVVVNGFVQRVDSAAVPERVRAPIAATVAPLVGERSLTLAEIERRLLLAGDTPGVALTSSLSAGSDAGATLLTLDAAYEPVTGFVGLDNTLADDLGTWTLSTGLELNSLLGRGETFYLRASGYPGGDGEGGYGGFFTGYPRTRTLGGGVVWPLGTDGLTFNVEGTGSRTTPEPTDDIQTRSEFDRLSFRLAYPWIRSRNLNVVTTAIFDATSESQHLMGASNTITLSQDRLRVLRFGAGLQKFAENGGTLNANVLASFGLDALGARGEEEASGTPLSRQGADADFQKLEVSASWQQPVRDHLAYQLYARGQTSFGQPLATSEQIGIADFQELSTFDAGTIGGDSGWVVRGDVQSPWATQWLQKAVTVTPYLFGATGGVHLEQPTVLEPGNLNVSALGFGVQIGGTLKADFSEAWLTVEYGRAYRDDGEPDDNRLTVVGSYRF